MRTYFLGQLMTERTAVSVAEEEQVKNPFVNSYNELYSLWNERKRAQKERGDPQAFHNDFETFSIVPYQRAPDPQPYLSLIHAESANFVSPEDRLIAATTPIDVSIRSLGNEEGAPMFISAPEYNGGFFMVLGIDWGSMARKGGLKPTEENLQDLNYLVQLIRRHTLQSDIILSQMNGEEGEVFLKQSAEKDLVMDVIYEIKEGEEVQL